MNLYTPEIEVTETTLAEFIAALDAQDEAAEVATHVTARAAS